MHVACPECGTGYTLNDETLQRPRLRLRCHKCGHVWDPRRPLGEAAPPTPPVADTATESAADAPGETRPEPVRGRSPGARRNLSTGLLAAAMLLAVAGMGGVGYGLRDRLPGFGQPLPELTDVVPEWRDGEQGRRLVIGAVLHNPDDEGTEVDRVRVKFLSEHGAWIDEIVVDVPAVVVAAGEATHVEIELAGLPEGTASLELSAVPVF